MRKAWIALSLAPAVALFGCKSEPEPMTQVPPPNYSSEPEALPPVSINEGSTLGQGSSSGAYDPGAGAGTTAYEPEPLPPAQPSAREYTVRKGDTLWAIARREYGDGQRWVDIAQANPSLDPKKMVIGKSIVLP